MPTLRRAKSWTCFWSASSPIRPQPMSMSITRGAAAMQPVWNAPPPEGYRRHRCRIPLKSRRDCSRGGTLSEVRTSRHALLFIFITMLIDMIGLGIVIPVMPKIIVSLIGGTLGDAAPYGGWLFDAYAIMQFLFAPMIGNLSDRFGRRPVLIVALGAPGIH